MQYCYLLLLELDDANTQNYCCERCEKRSCMPRLCCDMCNPEAFLLFYVAPPPKASNKRKVKVSTSYKMSQADFALQDDLLKWREQQAIEEDIDDDFFGPQLILSDSLLDRILALSHHSKLPNIIALRDQTDWVYVQEYGEMILGLIRKHFPPPAPSSHSIPVSSHILVDAPANAIPSGSSTSTLAHQQTGANGVAPKKARKPTQCSKCKAYGHNCTFSHYVSMYC